MWCTVQYHMSCFHFVIPVSMVSDSLRLHLDLHISSICHPAIYNCFNVWTATVDLLYMLHHRHHTTSASSDCLAIDWSVQGVTCILVCVLRLAMLSQYATWSGFFSTCLNAFDFLVPFMQFRGVYCLCIFWRMFHICHGHWCFLLCASLGGAICLLPPTLPVLVACLQSLSICLTS